jgi:hypothetical protein
VAADELDVAAAMLVAAAVAALHGLRQEATYRGSELRQTCIGAHREAGMKARGVVSYHGGERGRGQRRGRKEQRARSAAATSAGSCPRRVRPQAGGSGHYISGGRWFVSIRAVRS